MDWILREEFGSPELSSNASMTECVTYDESFKHQTQQNIHELQVADEDSIISKSSSRSSIIPYIRRIAVKRRDVLDSDGEDQHFEDTQENASERRTASKLESYQPEMNKKKNLKNNALSQFDKLVETANNKQKKKRTLCKFCNISVTNFERHLLRHHLEEKQVQDYLSFPKNTKEGRQMRRNILALLRYETNFEQYVKSNENHENKLPCSHCKRIISERYLRRHYKKCIVKPINDTGRNVRYLAASQTLVAYAGEHGNTVATMRVKNEVFSRMAFDEIGVVARKDALIRHFGEFYLKKHKRAQIFIACSNKMRECSRLLIEMRRRLGRRD